MTLPSVARWLRGHHDDGALILMYHRVADLACDPWGLAVTPRHFAQQLAVLRAKYFLISLREVVAALARGELPRRAVVITFDDGYADNVEVAKPALEKFDIPATVFISTGHVEDRTPFWWDDVDRVILQAPELPARLEIQAEEVTYRWTVSASQRAMPSKDVIRSWRAWNAPAVDSREALFLELYQFLDAMRDDTKKRVVGFLKEWAGLPFVSDNYRVVSSDDIKDLVKDGLIDVGAHTMSHSRLAQLAPNMQRDEIFGSRDALEKIAGRAVESFAYPHGLRTDYTQDTIAAVREAGFDHACAAYPGVVTRGIDAYELPRRAVPDIDGSAFEAWLSQL